MKAIVKKVLRGVKITKRDQVKQEIGEMMRKVKYDAYIKQGLSPEDAEYRSKF